MAPAPPATGGSTAPRRKILVRSAQDARDALMQTAEAEAVKSLRPRTRRGPARMLRRCNPWVRSALTPRSTPASSTAGPRRSS